MILADLLFLGIGVWVTYLFSLSMEAKLIEGDIQTERVFFLK